MKLIRLLAACGVAATLMLTGCASYVTTNVTAFQNWSGKDSDRTYAFARTPDQQNSLEQGAYEGMVGNQLATYGFKQIDGQHAHYSVILAYDIRNQTTMVSQPVAVVGPGWRGGWYPGWYGPFPPYGPTSVIYDTEPYPLFVKLLSIRIYDNTKNNAQVYAVSASTTDPDGSLVSSMPYLVRSALFNFPLPNGTATQVNLPQTPTGAPNETAASAAPAVAEPASSTVAK